MAGTDRGYSSYNPWRFGDCITGGILRWITIFYGVMAIVTGITDIIFYAKSERYIGFAPCVSARCRGDQRDHRYLALMAYPHIGELVVTLLLPLWFIAHSVSKLCHLGFIRSLYRGRYFLCLTGHQCDRSGSRCADDILAADCFVLSRIFDRYIPDYIRSRQCSIGLQ